MWFMNKIANPIVGWILRSPLHGLISASLLLISYRGRKSGREYGLPVQYAKNRNQVYIIPGQPKGKTWWRNFRKETPVTITLGGKTLSGQARLLDPQSEAQAAVDGLGTYLQRFPGLAKMHHVGTQADGSFNPDDLRQAATTAKVICVTLGKESSL